MSTATGSSSFSPFLSPIQVSFHVDRFEVIVWAIKSALETSKDFSTLVVGQLSRIVSNWLREELQAEAARGDMGWFWVWVYNVSGLRRQQSNPGWTKVSAALEISWVETCPKISPHSPRFTGTSLSVGGFWISVVIFFVFCTIWETLRMIQVFQIGLVKCFCSTDFWWERFLPVLEGRL